MRFKPGRMVFGYELTGGGNAMNKSVTSFPCKPVSSLNHAAPVAFPSAADTRKAYFILNCKEFVVIVGGGGMGWVLSNPNQTWAESAGWIAAILAATAALGENSTTSPFMT